MNETMKTDIQKEINELNEAIAKANEVVVKATAARDGLLKKHEGIEDDTREPKRYFAVPGVGQEAQLINQSICTGRYFLQSTRTYQGEAWTPCPTTPELAEAFAEALNIWKEWNACDGVEAVSDDYQYVLDYKLMASVFNPVNSKIDVLSPCFDTYENAKASVEKIGAERIRRMRSLFHFKLD